ncbi:MAG: phosphate signaling complex protein PhoU [Spirochaetes bacterium]|jgi:phosphate transport system protein|nr:phosphate signaling complex protein PhoU [Spirochaetota bacterium]
MTTRLEQELENLRIKIFEMADMAIEALEGAVDSLKNSDAKLAEKVIQNDSALDRMEIAIDDECIRIIVTKQPAAIDLRFVLTIIKMNAELERIGDLSTNIAKETIRLNGNPPLKPLIDIPRMSATAIEMIKSVFEAFSDRDAVRAKLVIDRDREMDDLKKQIHRELFSYLSENPKTYTQVFGLITVAQLLERIGDHATNMAERVIYFVKGIDVRHTQSLEEGNKRNNQ